LKNLLLEHIAEYVKIVNMKNLLLERITEYNPLDLLNQKVLLSFLHVKRYEEQEAVLEPGQVCDELYFVVNGSLRMYRTAEQGQERLMQLASNECWISDLYSFQSGEPSNYFIRASVASDVIYIKREHYPRLFSVVPVFERYFRMMMQREYEFSLKKIERLLGHHSEKQFIRFSELHPDLISRVSLPMLASLLGVSHEFASFLETKYQLSGEGQQPTDDAQRTEGAT
jgi:CRP/FNR family transcriptional regulator